MDSIECIPARDIDFFFLELNNKFNKVYKGSVESNYSYRPIFNSEWEIVDDIIIFLKTYGEDILNLYMEFKNLCEYQEEYYYKTKIFEVYNFYNSIKKDVNLLKEHRLITENYNYINDLLSQITNLVISLDTKFIEKVNSSNIDEIVHQYTYDMNKFKYEEIEFYSKLINKSIFYYGDSNDMSSYINPCNMNLLYKINEKVVNCLDDTLEYRNLFLQKYYREKEIEF